MHMYIDIIFSGTEYMFSFSLELIFLFCVFSIFIEVRFWAVLGFCFVKGLV
jgi:hypothetical protein